MITFHGRKLRQLLCAAGLFAALLPLGGFAQTPPAIPSDVQAIMNKMQSGQQPTAQELQRLQTWSQSMATGQTTSTTTGSGQTQAGGGMVGVTGGGVAGSNVGTLLGSAGGPLSAANAPKVLAALCPKPSQGVMPSKPPTEAEYVALLKTIVARYGALLDSQTRVAIELGLTKSGAQAGSVGAVLHISGALNESVYAAAFAAQRNPVDPNAANNLGVGLSGVNDYATSAQVLLYLSTLRPNSPLAALNLAWTYFNAGADAAAKKEFQHAQALGADMAGPGVGLGLLAGCQGNSAQAQTLLTSALSKGYSSVGAMALQAAQAAQSSSSSSSGQGSASSPSTPSPTPPSSPPADSSNMIPDLPVYADPGATAGQVDGLTRVANWSASQNSDLWNRMGAAAARVRALNRRATVQGDALNLPLVFDAQLFEYHQMADLAYAARFRNVGQVNAEVTQAATANVKTTGAVMMEDEQKALQLGNRQIEIVKEMTACGGNAACEAKFQKQLDEVQAQEDQVAYQTCLHGKQSMDSTYTQDYKMWKAQWDDFRPASADVYAFTDPVIAQVWAPALNEFLATQREYMVMAIYAPLTGEAAELAKMAQGYKDLTCVPPPPPPPAENAKQANLPQKRPSNCPFDPPRHLGSGPLKLTFACDHFTIEGGEIVRGKINRNFTTKETTLWGGVGVSAGGGMDFLGPMSPQAELAAQGGVGMTVGQGGALTDVFVSGEASATASLPGAGSTGMSLSGTWSLESGPTFSGSFPGAGNFSSSGLAHP